MQWLFKDFFLLDFVSELGCLDIFVLLKKLFCFLYFFFERLSLDRKICQCVMRMLLDRKLLSCGFDWKILCLATEMQTLMGLFKLYFRHVTGRSGPTVDFVSFNKVVFVLFWDKYFIGGELIFFWQGFLPWLGARVMEGLSESMWSFEKDLLRFSEIVDASVIQVGRLPRSKRLLVKEIHD